MHGKTLEREILIPSLATGLQNGNQSLEILNLIIGYTKFRITPIIIILSHQITRIILYHCSSFFLII